MAHTDPSSQPDEERDFSPRKIRVAAAILLGQTFATSILPFSAFSLLIIPLTHEFGWTRTQISFATTFIFIFGAASLWPIGRLADRIGVRPVIIIGTIIVGLVTLAMSLQTRSLPQLYLYYALLGIFGSTGVAYSKIVAGLFNQNRGKALAILGAESTVAMALVPLLTNALLLHFGWRTMYLAFGAIILVTVPILFIFLEEPGRPTIRQKAKLPPAPAGAPAPQRVLEGMTIKEALRDRVFWLIVLAGIAGLVIATGMLSHMIPALIGKGFTQTQAVETTSASMLIGLVGTLLGGYLIDRFQTTKVAAPFNLLAAVAAFLLLIVSASVGGLPLLITAVGLNGFAMSAHRPMGTYFQTRFFGLRSFTEISSVQFTITNPITAFATPLIGLIYDTTHSYDLAFELMIAAALAGGAVWLCLPKFRFAANTGFVDVPAPIATAAAEPT